jgi:hypothetical protein
MFSCCRLRGNHGCRVVPGVLLFFLLFTGKGISSGRDRHRLLRLEQRHDLAGVYIRHALPIVQQQLLDAGIHLAKIIDGNFWERSCTPELVLYRHESNP